MTFHGPGDWKWPFNSVAGGHLTFERVRELFDFKFAFLIVATCCFWQIKCFQQIAWGKWFDLHFCVFLSGSHSLCSVPDTDLYRKMSGQLKFLFVWFKGLKCSTGRAHWAEETHMTKIIQAVTFLSPSWRSVYLWKGHNIDHPKKVTKTCQGLVFFCWCWPLHTAGG